LTPDEKATPARLLGVAFGLAGVAVMIGPAALANLTASVAGELACLGAALSYAFAGVFGRRFRRLGLAPGATAFGQLSASTVMMLPLAGIVDRFWTLPFPSGSTMAALSGLALLSTALAYILFFRLLAAVGATNLLLVTFLIPVSAILLGVLFLHERLSSLHLAGMGLIGLGLAVLDGRLWGRIRDRRPDDSRS
jgi:drug/metabolite transporter (DMT)-like permease